jgi:divalent metal cation (Fe/Co/Zn/Cd) transporter
VAETHALSRPVLLERALLLTLATLGWNVVEGVVALTAAAASGSVALLGFGVDSAVESASAAVMLWRLSVERRGARSHREVEALDRRAHRLIGLTLLLLAAFIAWEAAGALVRQERPEPSAVGMALTTASLLVMVGLARAKRRTAAALGSRAMQADAFQTTACWWLSLITLGGIGLNAAFGLWWADPLAALGMTALLVKEGREGLKGEACCG